MVTLTWFWWGTVGMVLVNSSWALPNRETEAAAQTGSAGRILQGLQKVLVILSPRADVANIGVQLSGHIGAT
jgi:hypothetical protein